MAEPVAARVIAAGGGHGVRAAWPGPETEEMAVSHTKAVEVVAAHLLDHEGAWLCDRCLALTLRPLDLAVADAAEAVRRVADELHRTPGFELGPALCARCQASALVALRYVRAR
jgi:hypothetical protein